MADVAGAQPAELALLTDASEPAAAAQLGNGEAGGGDATDAVRGTKSGVGSDTLNVDDHAVGASPSMVRLEDVSPAS